MSASASSRGPEQLEGEALRHVQEGLRMAYPPDPAALAAERDRLRKLEDKPFLERSRGYLGLLGPGFL